MDRCIVNGFIGGEILMDIGLKMSG